MNAISELDYPDGGGRSMPVHQRRLPIHAHPAGTPSGRRSPRGEATSALVVSAHIGTNADVFPEVLRLHVSPGARIADVTYGKGVFWRKVPTDDYDLLATDLATGMDCRALPYDAASLVGRPGNEAKLDTKLLPSICVHVFKIYTSSLFGHALLKVFITF